MVALIPARAGSKRIPGKNTKLLAGHPLVTYTIEAARQSGVFDAGIVVCSDDHVALDIGMGYGVGAITRCAAEDDQPDIYWIADALQSMQRAWDGGRLPDQFAILRPTSPFRTADTIRRAYDLFRRTPDVDSLRAVEPVKQHPGKTWTWEGPGYPMTPLLSYTRSDGIPWHSAPTQSLPTFYIQNSSLEMAWTRTVTQLGSIAGKKVLPFFTEGYEGFSIDYPEDWEKAEHLVASGRATLPEISARFLG